MIVQDKNFSLPRLAFSFPVMLTVLLLGVVWALSSGRVNDADLWWHLRNAEYLVQTHHLPNHDTYSFTVAGQEWMNHEWLAELPFYAAWRMSGLIGIAVLRLILVESIFLFLLYLCTRSSGNIKASILACGFCAFLGSINFGPRMILFGYLYMVLELVILERFRVTGGRVLWLLPPLFCLWVNTHGSWLFGLILLGVVAAAGFVEGSWGRVESFRWTTQQLRRVIAAGLASVAALFVNPFGWKLVLYPILFGSKLKIPIASVTEWSSVDFHDARGTLAMVVVIELLLAALVRDRRWLLAEIGCLLFALYCGLTYARFLFFLAIILAPLLAKLLDFVPRYEPELDKPILNVMLVVIFVAGVVHSFPLLSETALQSEVTREYPAQILPYLRAHPPTAPVLNDFLWCGYLIFHEPNLKVFIDSRVDIFEDAGVFRDYLDLVQLKNPQSLLDKYGIRYVLFPPAEQLTHILERDPRWKVNYRDSVSVLFERVIFGQSQGI